MARTKTETLTICSLLVIFTWLALFVSLKGQVSEKIDKPNQTSSALEELKKDFPVVDYFNSRTIDSKRQKKSEKYGMDKVIFPDPHEDSVSTSFLDWEVGLPLLPVNESEIIVLGKVTDVQAHLATNKESVYTEITFEIEKQFKNTSQSFSEGEKLLTVERDGGIVRFPSGFKTFYYVSGQRMPKISKKYLFFLTGKFPLYGYKKGELYLITAYELSGGKVIPLDSPGGGTHKIATFYRDKSEIILLNDLRDALRNSDN